MNLEIQMSKGELESLLIFAIREAVSSRNFFLAKKFAESLHNTTIARDITIQIKDH